MGDVLNFYFLQSHSKINIVMGRLIKLFFLLGALELLGASPALAQQGDAGENRADAGKALSESRWFLSLDIGPEILLPGSNLSPYGEHYRKDYGCGIGVDLNLSYMVARGVLAGVKCDASVYSGNYALHGSETRVSDDVGLIYVLPQLGERFVFGKRLYLDWMIGAGYVHYRSESLADDDEREFTKGLFGYNVDVSLNYRVGKSFATGCSVSWLGGKNKDSALDTERLNLSLSLTAFW